MKTKIFSALFAMLAFMAVNARAFAQVEQPVPPTPPAGYKLDKTIDDKEYKQKMAELKVKMADLTRQMAALSAKQGDQITAAINKKFDKKFTAKFKEFGKDFAGSFKGMVPEVSGSFKNLDGVTFRKFSNEEYKKKVASGQIIEKIKNYSKTYSVASTDLLQISNSFGRVTVNTWNKNEFKVDVQMKFSGPDAESVNEMVNGSGITDSKVGSTVSFKTTIFRNDGNSDRNGEDQEVNYTVYMPAGNPVDITNKFGDVTLPDLSGKANIRVNFGILVAQRLTNTQNDVQIKFTEDRTATIALFNGGKLKADFSKLKAGTLDNADATFGFSDIDIARIKGTANMSVKFGRGLNIAAVDRSVKNVNITATNTKVNVDFKESSSFSFDVTTRFGSFNMNEDNMKVTSKTPADDDRKYSSTKIYKGYIGKNNADSNITVNGRFTDIRFE